MSGAQRLLPALIRRGLRPDAIVAAAALCAALDRPDVSDDEAKAVGGGARNAPWAVEALR